MIPVRSDIVGKEICEALNIPTEDIYHIGMDFTVGKVAIITIGRFVKVENGKELARVLTKYHLEPANGH